jgi:hypothetical protein
MNQNRCTYTYWHCTHNPAFGCLQLQLHHSLIQMYTTSGGLIFSVCLLSVLGYGFLYLCAQF